jgi:hypothetical protein
MPEPREADSLTGRRGVSKDSQVWRHAGHLHPGGRGAPPAPQLVEDGPAEDVSRGLGTTSIGIDVAQSLHLSLPNPLASHVP